MENQTLNITKDLFTYYKKLGEKAIDQIEDKYLFHTPDDNRNSISVIIKHLHGNMLSRWTDFLTSDGEKEWRKRDEEFEGTLTSRQEVMKLWEEGWKCLFASLNALTVDDLKTTVYIRNMGQSAEEAILRQLAHYAYHVGQIVYLARMLNEGGWQSLSIPKNTSQKYNQERFDQEKQIKHFTEENG